MRYRLSMPEPHSHLFHVELAIERVAGDPELVFPVWTPGSYLVREYARHGHRRIDRRQSLRSLKVFERPFSGAANGSFAARLPRQTIVCLQSSIKSQKEVAPID